MIEQRNCDKEVELLLQRATLPLSMEKLRRVSSDSVISAEDSLLTIVSIFRECGLVEDFNINEKTLLKWLLVVKENCNQTHPYHNWTHAFVVTQCVFSLISTGCLSQCLTSTDKLIMLVAALCHELCYNDNRPIETTESANVDMLTNMYSTPWDDFTHMECIIGTLYNLQECNIFEYLSADEELEILDMISSSMAATDLCEQVEIQQKFSDLVHSRQFSWSNPEHSGLFRCVTLTVCGVADLRLAKPWAVHKRMSETIVKGIRLQVNLQEQQLAEMHCDLIKTFLPLLYSLTLVCAGFQSIYYGAVNNYVQWLDVIAQGQEPWLSISEDGNLTHLSLTTEIHPIQINEPKHQGCESEPTAISANKDAIHNRAPEIDECSAVTVNVTEQSATLAIQDDVKHVGQALKTNRHIVVLVGDTDHPNREAAAETQLTNGNSTHVRHELEGEKKWKSFKKCLLRRLFRIKETVEKSTLESTNKKKQRKTTSMFRKIIQKLRCNSS